MLLTDALIKRIKELIDDRKITQYELFKRSGVIPSTINMILKGKVKTIKLDTLFDLCYGLNIELSDFFACDYLKFENVER